MGNIGCIPRADAGRANEINAIWRHHLCGKNRGNILKKQLEVVQGFLLAFRKLFP